MNTQNPSTLFNPPSGPTTATKKLLGIVVVILLLCLLASVAAWLLNRPAPQPGGLPAANNLVGVVGGSDTPTPVFVPATAATPAPAATAAPRPTAATPAQTAATAATPAPAATATPRYDNPAPPRPSDPVAPATPADITLNGVKVGIIDPRVRVEHCSAYFETGVEGQAIWQIGVPSEGTLIVGGETVDGARGVLKAYGPGGHTRTVKNGFACVTASQWAEGEFNFRREQAIQYGWAYNVVEGLSDWKQLDTTQGGNCNPNLRGTNGGGCQAPAVRQQVAPTPAVRQQVAPVATAAPKAVATATGGAGERKLTGKGNSMAFTAGTPVLGFRITLQGGKVHNQCYLANPPSGGTLLDGVMNPSPGEIAGMKPC